MALTQRTRIREVLIVQSDDDLKWVAHQVPITEILDGDKIISATYGSPESLAMADVGSVLSQALIDITNERDSLKTQIADQETAFKAQLADQEATFRAQSTDFQNQIAAMSEQIAALQPAPDVVPVLSASAEPSPA